MTSLLRLAGVWIVVVTMTTSGDADDRPPREIPPGVNLKDRFLALIDRPQVPLDPTLKSSVHQDGVVEQYFEFTSEKSERVPCLLAKSATVSGPQPVVIVLHGTGGSKATVLPILRRFAARNVIAVAFDARFSGDRAAGAKGSEAYRAAILQTWKSGRGFPFLYDTVWDLQRLIDYLVTRQDVDPDRIGGIGFSKGGMELYLAAAVDPRIKASVPCIGVQSFDWGLQHDAWQSRVATIQSAVEGAAREMKLREIDETFIRRFYRRVVPGIESEFDGPNMLPLIAPRHLLVINGELDDRTPGPGLQLCIQAARDAYQKAHASEKFEFRLQPNVGHSVTPESELYATDWLLEHLQ